MKYCFKLLFFVYALFGSFSVNAGMKDYAKYFVVDLDAPLPDIEELQKEYQRATDIYNPRYMVSWDMGPVFDKVWSSTITSFGTSEKYIKSASEQEMYDLLMTIPKEYYPYVGPMLHTLPGISDRILMLPGIKETKNKFPERIAPQLANIEDIEFLSPHLYLLLIPEMWPSNQKPVEKPIKIKAKIPQFTLDQKFLDNAMSKVPEQGFGGAFFTNNKPGPDKLRTLKITKNSPLTTGDIRAFLRSIDRVKSFATFSNTLKIISAGHLLDYWEQKNGTAIALNGLKDGVNPCQRLALKVKWAGLEDEFVKEVGQEGFGINEWAYTCDKTIKAYRVARVSVAKISSMRAFKSGAYDKYINTLKPVYRERQYSAMQSIIEMHKAPKSDVYEALKNERLISDKLIPLGGMLISSPIVN